VGTTTTIPALVQQATHPCDVMIRSATGSH